MMTGVDLIDATGTLRHPRGVLQSSRRLFVRRRVVQPPRGLTSTRVKAL